MIDLKIDRADGKIKTQYTVRGNTDSLLDELAAGAAEVIIGLADDLGTIDGMHEAMAHVVCGMIVANVNRALAARDGQAGPDGEDA